MANRTDPTARSVHGTNPQNLVEKILRSKIYQNTYWKEQCFGLTGTFWNLHLFLHAWALCSLELPWCFWCIKARYIYLWSADILCGTRSYICGEIMQIVTMVCMILRYFQRKRWSTRPWSWTTLVAHLVATGRLLHSCAWFWKCFKSSQRRKSWLSS